MLHSSPSDPSLLHPMHMKENNNTLTHLHTENHPLSDVLGPMAEKRHKVHQYYACSQQLDLVI